MSTTIMVEKSTIMGNTRTIVLSVKGETLESYVRRIMNAKNLKPGDVQRRSKGGVSDSYIGSILSGQARNLTVEKLKSLAKGLGVDEDELFAVVRGKPLDEDASSKSEFAAIAFSYGNAKKKASPKKIARIDALIEILKRELDEAQD